MWPDFNHSSWRNPLYVLTMDYLLLAILDLQLFLEISIRMPYLLAK